MDTVKKVCFYGPESTGKSTMAMSMARIYNTVFVPEVSKEFISSNNFSLEDIIRIGHAQTERILDAVKLANKIVFCDTDLITTQIYCRHYLKTVPDVLMTLEKKISFDRYFLFDIDVPWVADGLRDLGGQRTEMLQIFKEELKIRNINYTLVKGDWEERAQIIQKEVNLLLT